MGEQAPYYVLIRRGDGRAEVERVLRELGVPAREAGLHKLLYVARAEQTVVMLIGREVPLAGALLAAGWEAPAQDEDEDETPSGHPA